jgi:hypothetical protein
MDRMRDKDKRVELGIVQLRLLFSIRVTNQFAVIPEDGRARPAEEEEDWNTKDEVWELGQCPVAEESTIPVLRLNVTIDHGWHLATPQRAGSWI